MPRYSRHTPGTLRIRTAPEGSESRTIEGYAIVFNQESVPLFADRSGKPGVEVIDPGAVTEGLLRDSDIVLTMHHDFERILGRSKQGAGTLAYEIDSRGVKFRCEMPRTALGDEAIEAVRRGDIDGCSFMFAADYGSDSSVKVERGKERDVYRVVKIERLYDFTLTPHPAYPATECEARTAREPQEPAEAACDGQVAEMREAAKMKF